MRLYCIQKRSVGLRGARRGLQYLRKRGLMTARRLLEHKIVYRSLTLAFIFVVTLMTSAGWSTSQGQSGTPAYNAGPPPKGTKLPPILSKHQLCRADAQNPYHTHHYALP